MSSKKVLKFKYIGYTLSIVLLFTFFLSSTSSISNRSSKIDPQVSLKNQTENLPITRPTNKDATYIDVQGIMDNVKDMINFKQYVYNVNPNDIRKVIYQYVINPATGFILSNIQFDKNAPSQGYEVDAQTGEIHTTIILQRFINDAGNIQTTGFKPVKITFGKFYPAPGETGLKSEEETINANNFLPQDVYNDESFVMKQLENNKIVQNVPVTCNVSISNFKFSNSEGYISMDIWVDGYFEKNQKNEFIFYPNNRLLKSGFKMRGFKQLLKTEISSIIKVQNADTILPTSFINNIADIKKTIFDNLNHKPDFMVEDDVIINQLFPVNNNGTMIVNYSCTNIYDFKPTPNTANFNGQDIQLLRDITPRERITLTGFSQAIPTVFPATIDLNDVADSLAQDFNDDQIKLKLLESIQNINNINITAQNINVNLKQIDNINGAIIVTPRLDKFVLTSGLLYDIPGSFMEFPSISINGFKKVRPTKIIDNADFSGDAQILPSQALENIDIVREIIKKNLENLPENFNNDNIILVDSSHNNKMGTLTIAFTLNNYYDDSGLLVKTDSFPIQYISMKDFKKIEPTTIKKQVLVDNVANIAPFDFTQDQLVQYIQDNVDSIITPIPNGFDFQKNLFVEQVNKFNSQGYIEAFVKVNYFYDYRGEIVDDDMIYSKVRFIGFANINSTTIKESVFLNSVSDTSAMDVNEAKLKDLLFDDSDPNAPKSFLIENFPKNFTKDNIFIRIVDRVSTSTESYMIIDVSLDHYYNKDGFLVQSSSVLLTQNNVKIYGFKKVAATEINSSYRVAPSTPYSNVYASDVPIWARESTIGISIEQLIYDNLPSFFTNYPTNITIKNIFVKNILNDSGSMILNLDVLNYYNSVGMLEGVTTLSKEVTISGFKAVGPTIIAPSFAISGVSDILASTYSESKILDIIWNNKEFIFTNIPSNFSKNDIEVMFDKNAANNLKGEISANVVLHNYFDSFGALQNVIPLKKTVVFTGFKDVLPTVIVSNISIVKPGINKVLPSEFSDRELLEYIFSERNNIFINLPNEFDVNSIVLNSNNVKRSNLVGQIIIDPLSISVYYDQNGNLINNSSQLYSSPITISGFASINVQTSIENDVDVKDTSFSDFLPADISIDMLKKIVIEKSVIHNKSPSFSIFDIVSSDSDIKTKKNLDGEIVVELKIKNYYNKEGIIINDLENTLNSIVTFRGFKSVLPTATKESRIPNVQNLVASRVSNNQLLQIVRENYDSIFIPKSLPSSFSKTNITSVDKKAWNNLDGSIDCNIALNNYYDNDGTLVSNGFTKYISVKINGFRVLQATELVKDDFPVVQKNKLASDLSISEVSQIIIDNSNFIFEWLPDDFTKNNILINNLSPNNARGEILVDFSINYYIDKHGELIKTSENHGFSNLDLKVIISGFKVTGQTVIKRSYTLSSGTIKNYLPSNVRINDITKLIVDSPTNFIENPYLDTINIANDIFISNLRPNNLDGSILFNLSLSKYYDEKGILVDNKLLSGDVKIDGLVSQQQTEFKTKVSINRPDTTTIPQLIKNYELVNIIFDNKNLFFVNLPANFDRSHIIVDNIDKYNNIEGSLEAILKINYYFNKEGVLEFDNPYQYRISISGFKKILPSSIEDEVLITNFSSIPNNIASHFFNNPDILKRIVSINRRNIFHNMPQYFDDANEFSKALRIDPISYNNAEGYLIANLMISEYYSDNEIGEYINNQNVLSKNVKISGFTPSFATKVFKDQFLVENPSNYGFATAVSDSDIEYIIKNQYHNFLTQLPPNFQPNNIVSINKINANDIQGNILVKFSLNLFYDEDGVIISNGKHFSGEVTISGFTNKKFSTFIDKNGKSIPLGTFGFGSIITNLPNIYPSQIDDYYSNKNNDDDDDDDIDIRRQRINDWLYEVVIVKIENLDDISKTNVFVYFREKILSDQEGYIEAAVRILSYTSIKDGGETTTPTEFIVKIEGLKKKTTSTNITNNTLVIVIIVLSTTAVIAIISFLTFIFRFRIWRR